MPPSEPHLTNGPPAPEVLTLAETAAYLRVPEAAVVELVNQGSLPGQRIGGEWRFLKRAVVEWLRKPPAPKDPSPKPGSKQAVLRHFGVFKDDDDLEEQLAAVRARREAGE